MMPPIKRHEALIQYSKEHHFGLLLGWKVRQGIAKNIAAERIAKYILAACEAEVIPHFYNEEKELFVLLHNKDAFRLKAEKEHISIRKRLEAIGKEPTNENLNTFVTELDAHIRFEERELFPHIEQQQSFENYAAAMKAHEALPHADFDGDWDDHFWK